MTNRVQYILFLGVFLFSVIQDVSSSSTTASTTNTTSTTSTTNATSTSTITTSVAPNTTLAGNTVEQSDNLTPMVIGVTVGVSVVVIAVLVTAITFAILQKKKVYPSETDTIFSDSLSDSDFESRPTTASHIFIDPAEDAPSRPVTMTPFELRKLFVETFPFEDWKPGFDGRLKPRMPLRFVHPSRYNRTKSEEQEFRKNIYQFEMSENLTISRPPSSTRMSSRYMMHPSHTLYPVPERMAFQNGDVLHEEQNGDVINFEENEDKTIAEQNNAFTNMEPSSHDRKITEVAEVSNYSQADDSQNSERREHSINSSSSAKISANAAWNGGESANSKHNAGEAKSASNENGVYNEPNEGDIDIEQYDELMTTEL